LIKNKNNRLMCCFSFKQAKLC